MLSIHFRHGILLDVDPVNLSTSKGKEERKDWRKGQGMGRINQIKSNMTLIMVDKPQPSYNLLNVMK